MISIPLNAKVASNDFSNDVRTLSSMYSKARFKSDAISAEYREKGNELYKTKNYVDAVMTYNAASVLAESDENLAFLYGNRSAVCIELKKYEDCLLNIQLARDHKYPQEKLQRLENREQSCLELLAAQEEDEAPNVLTLSYEPNHRVSYLIDGLEVRINENIDRGIFATRNLKVGDIIYIEDFIKTREFITKSGARSKFCNVCSKLKSFTLVPCRKCNFALFCSKECQKYHELNECLKFDFTFDGVPTWTLHPFSIFDKLLAMADGSIDELEKLWTESQENPKTIFDLDLKNPKNPECQKNQLRAFFSFKTRGKISFFSHNGVLRIDSKYKSNVKFIVDFLQWIFKITIKESTSLSMTPGARHFSTVAPIIGLSCAPNIQSFCNRDKFTFYVTRPILAGEEILQRFLQFDYNSFEDRQVVNSIAFNSPCTCVACLNRHKYRILENLRHIPNQLLDSAVEKYEDYNFEVVTSTELAKIIKKMSEILQTSAAEYPHKNYVKGERILLNLFLELGER